jgi:hypothetical protein
MIMFEKGLPTMLSYLTTHSLADMLHRFLRGLVRVRGVEWVWPFLAIFVCMPKQWFPYFQAPPAKQPLVNVATSLVLTFYLAFSWSAVVQRGIRYLLPTFPIIFLMLADFLLFYAVRLARWWWPAPRATYLARLSLLGLIVVLSLVWMVQLSLRDFRAPLAIDFEDQATAELYRLLDTPQFDGKRVLFGPSHEFTGTWIFRHNVTFPLIPPGLSAAEFLPWLKEAGIDYILANREMIRRRRQSVGEYLAYMPGEGIQILWLAPAWEIVYQGPPPSRFVLIRVR